MVPVDQVATTANDVSLKWYDVILTIRSLWQTSKQILYIYDLHFLEISLKPFYS